MKILLLSKYTRKGASSRLRTMQYLPYLEKENISVKQQALFDEEYLVTIYSGQSVSKLKLLKLFLARILVLFTCKKYDLIWLEYEVFPMLPATIERLFNFFNVKYVVDYDDAIFHNYDMSSNPLIKRLLKHKIDVVMKSASAVVCGNQYLMNRAKQAGNKNVAYVPTVVDYERYEPKYDQDTNTVTIGWIGSPSTQRYIAELAPAFEELAMRYDIKLSLVGATKDISASFSNIDVEVLPWSEDRESSYIQSFDVGLMPLIDGPWEKGKCGYKLIQYMACAIPVIASPVGVNVDIVQGNQCGLLAGSNEDFYRAIAELIETKEKREEMGKLGREAVIGHFSLQAQAPNIFELFSSLIKK